MFNVGGCFLNRKNTFDLRKGLSGPRKALIIALLKDLSCLLMGERLKIRRDFVVFSWV